MTDRTMALLVSMGVLVQACKASPTEADARELEAATKRFERAAGVTRASCSAWGETISILRNECSGVLAGRPVTYACWLGGACRWLEAETSR